MASDRHWLVIHIGSDHDCPASTQARLFERDRVSCSASGNRGEFRGIRRPDRRAWRGEGHAGNGAQSRQVIFGRHEAERHARELR
jgi:hypothetical protein